MIDGLTFITDLRNAQARMTAGIQIALAPLDMTLPQALFLIHLHKHGADSQNALGRAIGFAGPRGGWGQTPVWDKRGEHDNRKCLVIAGALIVAEIERVDRAAQLVPPSPAGVGQ